MDVSAWLAKTNISIKTNFFHHRFANHTVKISKDKWGWVLMAYITDGGWRYFCNDETWKGIIQTYQRWQYLEYMVQRFQFLYGDEIDEYDMYAYLSLSRPSD